MLMRSVDLRSEGVKEWRWGDVVVAGAGGEVYFE